MIDTLKGKTVMEDGLDNIFAGKEMENFLINVMVLHLKLYTPMTKYKKKLLAKMKENLYISTQEEEYII